MCNGRHPYFLPDSCRAGWGVRHARVHCGRGGHRCAAVAWVSATSQAAPRATLCRRGSVLRCERVIGPLPPAASHPKHTEHPTRASCKVIKQTPQVLKGWLHRTSNQSAQVMRTPLRDSKWTAPYATARLLSKTVSNSAAAALSGHAIPTRTVTCHHRS